LVAARCTDRRLELRSARASPSVPLRLVRPGLIVACGGQGGKPNGRWADHHRRADREGGTDSCHESGRISGVCALVRWRRSQRSHAGSSAAAVSPGLRPCRNGRPRPSAAATERGRIVAPANARYTWWLRPEGRRDRLPRCEPARPPIRGAPRKPPRVARLIRLLLLPARHRLGRSTHRLHRRFTRAGVPLRHRVSAASARSGEPRHPPR
jgi:hypothetical protein